MIQFRTIDQFGSVFVAGPVLGAGEAIAPEVILLAQFQLALLLVVGGVMVAVVVEDFIPTGDPSDGSDGDDVSVAYNNAINSYLYITLN
jgi:hypothetical protein